MLSVFYVPFCVLVVPGVMLTRKVGPQYTIPGYMFGWGLMATVNAAAKNFAGVLIIRLRKCTDIFAAPSALFFPSGSLTVSPRCL